MCHFVHTSEAHVWLQADCIQVKHMYDYKLIAYKWSTCMTTSWLHTSEAHVWLQAEDIQVKQIHVWLQAEIKYVRDAKFRSNWTWF